MEKNQCGVMLSDGCMRESFLEDSWGMEDRKIFVSDAR